MLQTLAYILFFGIWCINYFFPFKGALLIIAIAAGVLALIALIGTLR